MQCAPGSDPLAVQKWPCEAKSRSTGILSSESTVCLNSKSVDQISDGPWFPNEGLNLAKVVPGAQYLFVNRYTGTNTCSAPLTTGSIDQDGYVADGKCYATEGDTFFKATCGSTAGTVFSCKYDFTIGLLNG